MNLMNSKPLLAAAQGKSEFIVASFLDIRGFSSFSRQTEAPNIAMYVKRLYVSLIDQFFSAAKFAKPTGDGLLLVFPYDETSLASVFQSVVEASLRCHAAFPNLCGADPMLNFELPKEVGFGIARGTACCLFAGEEVIDYSGHLLNLAARLNDIARPSGVVLDAGSNTQLLTSELLSEFKEDSVYLRGVSEQAPLKILVQEKTVKIKESQRHPIADERWHTQRVPFTKASLFKLKGIFKERLEKAPLSSDKFRVEIFWQNPEVQELAVGRRLLQSRYADKPECHLEIMLDEVKSVVPFDNLKDADSIEIEISYACR